ncbi:23266_t:CDS:1 [Cetraspora pellucida]|uniref:23266_t:CDS:1 n=1 Tax=Cetraspora pellucida TaxID=1433469 RepID=A0A9N9ICG6_9GLOM|nr:23266_t:CDS:1 [Cetraspora pellucida]
MATRVDTRGHTHLATDKTFHNLTRVASKKISTLRHRISSRKPTVNSLTTDFEFITPSNDKLQNTNSNLVQHDDLYFAEQRTYDDLESTRISKEILSRENDEIDAFTQELHPQLTILSTNEFEQNSTNEQPLKRNTSLGKVKNAVKRFASINKHERKRDSEAYHQDGKTNPFE